MCGDRGDGLNRLIYDNDTPYSLSSGLGIGTLKCSHSNFITSEFRLVPLWDLKISISLWSSESLRTRKIYCWYALLLYLLLAAVDVFAPIKYHPPFLYADITIDTDISIWQYTSTSIRSVILCHSTLWHLHNLFLRLLFFSACPGALPFGQFRV